MSVHRSRVSTQTGHVLLRPFWVISGAGSASGSAKDGCLTDGIEKFVQSTETAARKNQLPTDLRIAAAHETQQLDLLLGMRSEIGVAAFRGDDLITRIAPNQNGLTKSGAGGEKCAGTTGFGGAGVEYCEIARIEDIRCCGPRRRGR